MEDEKGLDLSLGLPCGGNNSSQKDKGKYGSSSDARSEEGDRGSKLINEFKNFLEGGSQQHPLKVEEKTSSVGEKRKNLYVDSNQQKKHERDMELSEKNKQSHISITTDEGSTAENEDVADSEVDGSTSRHINHDDVAKRVMSGGSDVEILGQKRFTISSEKEFSVMNTTMSYGVSFPAQQVNMNVSYSQPMPNVVHAMASTNGERTGVQPVMPANFPLYGYTNVQLPVLDRDNSRGIISQHQQIHPSYSGRNLIDADTRNDSWKLPQVIPHKSSESIQYDGRGIEHGKTAGKQQVGEDGSSSHPEGEPKGNRTTHLVKDPSNLSRSESIPSEFPAIRPGIAADLKFGGCGSYPNLPWVSTTGPGPNGRTISGVTYRYSPTQIRIVCACHGSHMSPEEFIRHASEENRVVDGSGGVSSLPGSNSAASALG